MATSVPVLASENSNGKRHAGPVYVPLDSWIYPALKRLAAMGYVPDQEGLVQPWTREQCAMFVEEAADIASRHSTKVSAGALNEEALRLISALEAEFLRDEPAKAEVRVESLYTQTSQIAGSPLRDSYHFGQTLVNDYGRPYGQGTNTVDGFSDPELWGRSRGTSAEKIRARAVHRPIRKASKTFWDLLTAFRLQQQHQSNPLAASIRSKCT
jgi:hypothetical protein